MVQGCCGHPASTGAGPHRQCETAFSAPAPVRDRTSISAYFGRLTSSRLVTLPSQPRKNASGIETMPGFSSGNQLKSTVVFVIIDRLAPVVGSTLPDTTGEKMIRPIEEIRPP